LLYSVVFNDEIFCLKTEDKFACAVFDQRWHKHDV
jgi:hypothetical protein